MAGGGTLEDAATEEPKTSERNASDPPRDESIARVNADSRVSPSGRAPGGSARHGTRRSGWRGGAEDHIDALGHAAWGAAGPGTNKTSHKQAPVLRWTGQAAPHPVPQDNQRHAPPNGIGVYRDALTAP